MLEFQQITTPATSSYKAPTLQAMVTEKGGRFAVDMSSLQKAAIKARLI